ncbi:hypothetical protein BG006_010340 [Podila minutissima]|uniref:MoaB/Mog domain-containing protein n=1 Tax=Podila minutissima TaxID=64525 RepID=A0A9P5VPT3_9FUNG|nr:hypothetical protein BG006_010340 [Podila minutissima]
MTTIRVGVLTVSDTASFDPVSDTSGPSLCRLVEAEPRYKVEITAIVPDDIKVIQKTVTHWCDDLDLHLVLTTGGTGFGVRDCTPEAVLPLLERQTPGISHLIFAKSIQITPFAALSRAISGIRGQTLVLTFPGSPKAVKENFEAVAKMLPHAIDLARGGTGKKVHEKMQGVSRRLRKSPYPLIAMDQALASVMDKIAPLPSTERPVNEALIGSVLDEDVVAVEAVPGYRAAILDGYAVIDTDGPGEYPVTAVSIATASYETPAKLLPGQIARITTGGALPEGATAVVMVEDTLLVKSSEDDTKEEIVEIRAKVRNGEAVREIGSDVKIGQIVLKKGQVISAVGGEIGVLASIGVGKVVVKQRPVVGFLSTGNEVVNHDNGQPLKMGQIRDSNRPTLIAATKAAGFDYLDLGIAPDSPEDLEAAVKNGLDKCEIVVTTGGVSMGEMDLLKPILEQKLGATIHFGRIMMKPGKPTTFATVPHPRGGQQPRLVFGLPGNPVSATVTFHLFVLPALRKLAGYEKYMWPSIQAEITHDIRLDERPEYQRAIVAVTNEGKIQAQSTDRNQMSSRMVTMLGANSLLVLPGRTAERANVASGDKVECLLIGKIV